jgi:hypothetical protein
MVAARQLEIMQTLGNPGIRKRLGQERSNL